MAIRICLGAASSSWYRRNDAAIAFPATLTDANGNGVCKWIGTINFTHPEAISWGGLTFDYDGDDAGWSWFYNETGVDTGVGSCYVEETSASPEEFEVTFDNDVVGLVPLGDGTYEEGEDAVITWSGFDGSIDVVVDAQVEVNQVSGLAGTYTIEEIAANHTVQFVEGSKKTLATHFIPRWEFAEDVFNEDGDPVRWIEGPETAIQVGNSSESESVAQGITVRAALTRVRFTDGSGNLAPWNGDFAGTGIHNKDLDYHRDVSYAYSAIVDQVTDPDNYDGARATYSILLDTATVEPVYEDELGGPDDPTETEPPTAPPPSTETPHEPVEGTPPTPPTPGGVNPGAAPTPTVADEEDCPCSPWYVDIAESINWAGEVVEYRLEWIGSQLEYIGSEIEFLEDAVFEGVQVLDSIQDQLVNMQDALEPILERIALALEEIADKPPVNVSVGAETDFFVQHTGLFDDREQFIDSRR